MRQACEFERETVKSLKSGFWKDELREHFSQCNECQEAARITALFEETEPEISPTLPQPQYLWWKALVARKLESDDRLKRKVKLVRFAGLGAFALMVTLISMIFGPSILQTIGGWIPGHQPLLDSPSQLISPAILMLAALALAATITTIYWLTAED